MNLSPRSQLCAGLALAALMAISRGHHFDGINLPGASWAVFFLAGLLLAPRWVFPALFIEASLLDFAAIHWQGVSDWCVSPAYWMLVPAYGSLWLGGRLYGKWHRDQPSSLATLVVCMSVSAFICYLFSGGGFLFFSGRYPEPTLAMLGERIATYYPGYLGSLAFYVGLATLVYISIRIWSSIQQRHGFRA
ncbi:hypothetical protein [Azomonas macrocytogenes]|uniref:Cobalamin ABC transporter n=1 Tax=Azomonas macrocytogenes TaxID=69962 RepID=A0A839T4B7_AZOMA|nr:hypothetical protein [Azomonas macrocytogenes]MBB3104272.1 hypothetical protein [Azomonas macrocytogenes]